MALASSLRTGHPAREALGLQGKGLERDAFFGYVECMIIDQIRQRLQNGFQPFALQLSNGRQLAVPQRDFIALHPKVVVVIDADGISHTINPLHIVTIEDALKGP